MLWAAQPLNRASVQALEPDEPPREHVHEQICQSNSQTACACCIVVVSPLSLAMSLSQLYARKALNARHRGRQLCMALEFSPDTAAFVISKLHAWLLQSESEASRLHARSSCIHRVTHPRAWHPGPC